MRWLLYLFDEHLAKTLAGLTFAAIPLLLWSLRKLRGMPSKKIQQIYDIIGILALVTALATSYGILVHPPAGLSGAWTLLIPSVLFFASVLLKLLIVFYTVAILSGLLQPGRILKFGAKLPGFEISNEYAQIGEAQAKLSETEQNYEMILRGGDRSCRPSHPREKAIP